MNTRGKSRAIVGVASLAAVVLLAGCGSDNETPTGAGPDASSGPCQLDKPIKLGFAWEIGGESSFAVDDYQNGAELALAEINAAGGVCGQTIEGVRESTTTVDPQAATASYLKLVDQNPSVILGLNSQVVIDGALSQIERNQIPVISLSPNDKAEYGTRYGGEYLWIAPSRSSGLAAASAKYALEKLHVKAPGFMGTNESFGNDALGAIKPVLSDAGVELTGIRQAAPGATDLTQDILALKDSDAIFDFGYPADIALTLKQSAQNGLDMPIIDGASADIVALYGLADAKQLPRLYASVDCTANATERPQMADFAKKYKAKYKALPFAYGVIAYDMVHFVAKVVEEARSADPKAINQAIASVSYDNGACGEYAADGAHTLHHSGTFVRFNSDGTAKTVAEFEIPTRDKA